MQQTRKKNQWRQRRTSQSQHNEGNNFSHLSIISGTDVAAQSQSSCTLMDTHTRKKKIRKESSGTTTWIFFRLLHTHTLMVDLLLPTMQHWLVRMVTYTLSSHYTGTVVHQDVGEDGEEHLEALVRFIASTKLKAEEDEEGGCSCLFLGSTCRQKVVHWKVTPGCECLSLMIFFNVTTIPSPYLFFLGWVKKHYTDNYTNNIWGIFNAPAALQIWGRCADHKKPLKLLISQSPSANPSETWRLQKKRYYY